MEGRTMEKKTLDICEIADLCRLIEENKLMNLDEKAVMRDHRNGQFTSLDNYHASMQVVIETVLEAENIDEDFVNLFLIIFRDRYQALDLCQLKPFTG